jgi:RimK-like ATP-grasp domain
MTVLLCGIPSETSLALVAEALDSRGAPVTMINQRQVRQLRIRLQADEQGLTGVLETPAGTVDVADVTGVYLRFMDDRHLPELAEEPEGSPARLRSRSFHDLVGQWADVCEARVVNRYAAMGSNFSKPYQSQLIRRHGFAVPQTLVTNDPDLVRQFRAEHGPLIYKSISSERSIVSKLDDADEERLERIRWCPVQFQGYVGGPNLRVHTVGEQVFPTIVQTEAVDYRYAVRQTGSPAEFAEYQLDDDLAARCVGLAADLGLDVAGLDLKLAPDGQVYCLEVNPSPVFSYYEQHTGQPIADAIAAYLVITAASEPMAMATASTRAR